MMGRQWVAVWLVAGVLLGTGVAFGQAPWLGQPAPDIAGGPWLNSAPLTIKTLRGHVVLVEFWTYG